MTKKERIQAAIRGEKPDKMPYSFWTHMPGTDLDPEAISQKTYEFYKKYDFDFVKTMNNGMYAIEDFGCTVDYSEIVKGGVAKVVSTPISCAADWRKLTVCPCTQGSNARELRHLQLVLEKLKGEEVPVIFTAFTPITIADKISGGKLISYIEEGHGDDVKAALEVITETTAQLVAAAIDMGADGIFLASQMSSYDKCTDRPVSGVRQALRPAGAGGRREGLDEHHPLPRRPHHVPHPQGLPRPGLQLARLGIPARPGRGLCPHRQVPHGRPEPDRHHPAEPGRHPEPDLPVLQAPGRTASDPHPGLRHPLPPGRRHALLYRDDSK